MSRIVSLGIARQEIILIDRDDFEELPLDGKSVFGKINIGAKIDIDKMITSAGGGGANAAIAFSRRGHESIIMSALAHDSAGDVVINSLDDESVDTSYIQYVRGATGCAITMLDASTAARTVLDYRGVSMRLSGLNPASLRDINPDWIYVSAVGGDMQFLLNFFETAKKLGVKIMWNPGAAELGQNTKLIGLLGDVDILIVNKAEAAQIVPGVILSELASRLSNYCKTVIITDGIMGAIATDHEQTFRLGVYEQSRTRDVTGAGDAFGAGFLAEYAKTNNLEKALRFASASASSVTATYGPTAGILSSSRSLHPMPIMQVENLNEWITEGYNV